MTSSTLHIGLLNARSIANKSFSLNDLFTREKLDLMCLSDTWQRGEEFIHLNELCPAGCSAVGKPRPYLVGLSLARMRSTESILVHAHLLWASPPVSPCV